MNCIIVHGTMGSPDENWFLWAQTEIAKVLECEKYEVLVPHFPYVVGNNENQGYDLWKKILLAYANAGLINEETILIGHSLGPVFIYRFLYDTKIKVNAVISVSGKNNNWLNLKAFDDFNFDFYCDWELLKKATKYAKYRYAYYSDCDPYIPLINCKKFANGTQSEEILLKGAGHINAAAGYTKFPELIELIKKIKNKELKETKQNKIKRFLDLEEPIEESADLICDVSHKLCANGVMDSDCNWYHSSWQYLRLLNLVSTPSWHDIFYIEQLQKALKKENNILISGLADYSMLAYVIDAIRKKHVKANIYVLDTCKTPLYACNWFAEKNNYPIKTINESILDYKNDNFFDIICTDSFLTRFTKQDAKKVIKSWNKLLKEDGTIITTIREHSINDNTINKEKCIEEFSEKAKERCSKNQNHIQYSPNKIGKMAEEYARKMISNNLGNTKDILSMFNNYKVTYQENTVLGEFYRTKYVELVAKKSNTIDIKERRNIKYK